VTWQELKDFVRQLDSADGGKTCQVIHAEVFNGKGYGWVQIKGEDDFWRAYRKLVLCNGHLSRCTLIDSLRLA
jgi:hypothetical protein